MGPSIVRLKGVASKSYLCMDNDGICRIMVSLVDDSHDTWFLVKPFLGWNSKNTPVLVYRLVNWPTETVALRRRGVLQDNLVSVINKVDNANGPP